MKKPGKILLFLSILIILSGFVCGTEYQDALEKSTDYLVSVQDPTGFWGKKPGGDWNADAENPTGNAITALIKAYNITNNVTYLDSAKKAGDYLISEFIQPDGSFDINKPAHHTVGDAYLNHMSPFLTAWIKLYQETNEEKYKDAAIAFGDYLLTNGARCIDVTSSNYGLFGYLIRPTDYAGQGCFGPGCSFYHGHYLNYGYEQIYGLALLYQVTGNPDYLETAEQGAAVEIRYQKPDGSLPAEMPDTGTLGIHYGSVKVLAYTKLYNITSNITYKDAAINYADWLLTQKNLDNSFGSGDYVRSTTWATKALLEVYKITGDPDYLIAAARASKWLLETGHGYDPGTGAVERYDSSSNVYIAYSQTPFILTMAESIADLPQVVYVDDDGVCGGNSPCFTVIQDGIDAAAEGGNVNVYDGTYNEQITVNKEVTIKAASSPVIDGQGMFGPAVNIQANNVILQGFIIKNFKATPSAYIGAILVEGDNAKIYSNTIHDINTTGDPINDPAGIGIDVHAKNVEITNNIVHDVGSIGIRVRHDWNTPPAASNNVLIKDNTVYNTGNTGVLVTGYAKGVTIRDNEIYNSLNPTPYNLFVHYGSEDVVIEDNHIHDPYDSIYGHNIVLAGCDNINISGNTVTGATSGKNIYILDDYNWGTGTFSTNIAITNNDILNGKWGVRILHTGVTSGDSSVMASTTRISCNNIYGNTEYGVENMVAGTDVNAENNWWGSADGPSGVGPGSGDAVSSNVDYDPWFGTMIVAVISGESVTPVKLFNYSNAWLNATINVAPIDSVWILGNWTGSWQSYTVTFNPEGSTYAYLVDSSFLDDGETFSWRYYANSTCGRLAEGSWQSFKVKTRTKLVTIPANPDGDNGWFVTLPCFELVTADPDVINTFYAWWHQLPTYSLYAGQFCFDWNATFGGIETLHYFSTFNPVDEKLQSYNVKVDITPPEINDLNPANDSIVEKREINVSAILDDIYQSNSGIDNSSIIMRVDGSVVIPVITTPDTIDRLIYHFTNLSDGLHTASIYCKDIAGSESYLEWHFTVNVTPGLEMNVSSPENTNYSERKVPVNVTLNKNADIIEYSLDQKSFRRFCRDCDSYYKERFYLSEGWHNLTIRAQKDEDIVSQNFSFLIDTTKPRIVETSPEDEEIIRGTLFTIEYTEDNLDKIILYWKASTDIIYEQELKTDCESGRNKECSIDLDLSAYDGQDINYYFELYDPVHIVESENKTITIDNTNPGVTIVSPQGVMYPERRVSLNIEIDESVEELEYSLDGERFRRLCRNCDSYDRVKSYRDGNHTLVVRAYDYAGNMNDTVNVSFSIDSRAPRIRSTEPRRNEYTNGNFSVEYTEENLKNVTLYYKEQGAVDYTGVNKSCPSGENQECTVGVAGLAQGELWYYFVVEDLLGRMDDSRETMVYVDTIPPEITKADFTIDGRRVDLDIEVSEEVEIGYVDGSERYKRLCSSCDSYTRSRSFSYGVHDLTIFATDPAANQDTEIISFTIIPTP